jgi:hypothetical protein
VQRDAVEELKRSDELRLVDQTVVDGVERQFEAIGDAELVEDIVEMVFNGLLADEELFADFLVAETLSDELDDFFFAVAEERLFAARAGLGRFGESLHDFGSHAIVEPDFAGENAMNAFDEKIGGGLFENHAARAQAHGANYVTIVFGGCEYYNASGNRVEIYFFQDGKAVFIGHAQIEQENVGLEFSEQLDALGAILSFADDNDIFIGAEEFAQAVAENRMVIREEDTNLLFCFGH